MHVQLSLHWRCRRFKVSPHRLVKRKRRNGKNRLKAGTDPLLQFLSRWKIPHAQWKKNGPGTGLASLNSDQAVISPKQSEFMYREQTPFGSEDGSYWTKDWTKIWYNNQPFWGQKGYLYMIQYIEQINKVYFTHLKESIGIAWPFYMYYCHLMNITAWFLTRV